MPSPIGHMLAGLAISRLFEAPCGRRSVVPVVLAAAPDVDMLPGLAHHQPNAFHAKASHALPTALAVGVVAGATARLRDRSFAPCFAEAAVAYGSHLVLDYFGKDPEDGIELFWPFSAKRYGTRHRAFMTLKSRKGHFFTGLFNRHNARAVARETAILLPFVMLAAWRRR